MSGIFDKNGNALNAVYDKSGSELMQAYDANGDVCYTKTGIPLRVMEYNAGQWYIGTTSNVPSDKDAEYYALQNGMISNADADILIICEYRDQFSQSGRTAESMLSQHFPYRVNYGGGGAYMGRAICSKYPITNFTQHLYTNRPSTSNNYYDSCTVTVSGIPVTVIVTHLSTQDIRHDEIEELIDYLETLDRFICAGDFNTLYARNTDGSDYQPMIVPLINAGFNLSNCDDFGFFDTYYDSDGDTITWRGCLDNIVTSSNIEISDVAVDDTKLSDSIVEKIDHIPLIADLLIQVQ